MLPKKENSGSSMNQNDQIPVIRGDKIICTMDTETDPFDGVTIVEPFTLGFYNGSSYYEFVGEKDRDSLTCIDKFIEFLDTLEKEEKETYRVYVHNGGKFDFFFMLHYIDVGSIGVINGRIIECKIRGVVFRDSFPMYPLALSTYEKEKFDYDRMKKENRYKYENFRDILKYQKSDCINLHNLVTEYIDRYGDVKTVSSAAFKQLKITGYEIKNTPIGYDEIFRSYYYGGRTQVFKSGVFKKSIVYYDINSAYPYAMMNDHPHGDKLDYFDSFPDNGNMYFAKILAISSGALPFREIDGKLNFPNDNTPREYFATSWEIETGIKTNTLTIIKIIEVIQHKNFENFKPFVDKFYKEKSECKKSGDKQGETFSKLILNSCYGKFALDPSRYTHAEISKAGDLPLELENWLDEYNANNIDEFKDLACMDYELTEHQLQHRLNISEYKESLKNKDITIWERPDANERFYNTATAASITGYVRAFMWKTICASDGVIYCDTDSIMCERFHGIKSDNLGDWKLECVFDELYIGGKKLYTGHIKDTLYNDSENWKKASKGSRLEYLDIVDIVKNNKSIKWCSNAPSFSIKNPPRFIDRTIRKTV